LIARLSDAEGTVTKRVDVFEAPSALFEVVSPEPHLVNTSIEFADLSTSDDRDPIASWSWDFGGWGSSSLQAPAPITFPQIGDFVVSLTITTESGATSTSTMPISILLEPPPEPEGG
jgi:PKD repeat protein